MYTNMLSNFPNFDIISKNIYNIQSYEGTDVASTSFLLKINDWYVWAYNILGWSEKHKSLKSKNGQADYLPRHSLDVRTVFEI